MEQLEWIDVTDNHGSSTINLKIIQELIKKNACNQDGKVIDGAESFLIIWKNIPKYNFLYKIFKIKPLFFLTKYFL